MPYRFLRPSSSAAAFEPHQTLSPIRSQPIFIMADSQVQYEFSANRFLDHSLTMMADLAADQTEARHFAPTANCGTFRPTSSSESSTTCETPSTLVENYIDMKEELPASSAEDDDDQQVEAAGQASQTAQVIQSPSPIESLPSTASPRSEFSEKKATFACLKCPKSFACARGLQSHMKAHKRRFRFTAKTQEMPIYDEDFDDSMDKDYEHPVLLEANGFVGGNSASASATSYLDTIKAEVGELASEISDSRCYHCMKKFSTLRALKTHLKVHYRPVKAVKATMPIIGPSEHIEDPEQEEIDGRTSDPDSASEPKQKGPVYRCTLCDKQFCRRNHLVFHLRVHSGERPYGCPDCPARFSRADSLKVHIRIHTGERPYACDICGAAFAQMINANVHRRCHTGEKPFGCEECGARFIKKDGLTVHRRIHTGEKPYTCNQCGAKFAYRSCILSHYKVHNGEINFRCDICNAGFSLLCNLTRHKKVHAA